MEGRAEVHFIVVLVLLEVCQFEIERQSHYEPEQLAQLQHFLCGDLKVHLGVFLVFLEMFTEGSLFTSNLSILAGHGLVVTGLEVRGCSLQVLPHLLTIQALELTSWAAGGEVSFEVLPQNSDNLAIFCTLVSTG